MTIQSPTSDQARPRTGSEPDPVRLCLSELVEATGVPASTVHHYLQASLVPPPVRVSANRNAYDGRHVQALRVIRLLRERHGLSLHEIGERLPALLEDPNLAAKLAQADTDPEPDVRGRLLDAATEAFRTQSFGEVTVSDVAEAAGVGKGSVYRHFGSKEELFTATIEQVLARTADGFAAAVVHLGGAEGVVPVPEETAVHFAALVSDALPLLLELGARAAKGNAASEELARRVLRTLAEATGRPLCGGASTADPITAGLDVIQAAFATMLTWAVGYDWPPDDLAEPADPPCQDLDRQEPAGPELASPELAGLQTMTATARPS